MTSAVTGDGMDPLLAAISHEVTQAMTQERLSLGFADGKKRAWLFEQEVVTHEEATEDGFALDVSWNATQKARFEKL